MLFKMLISDKVCRLCLTEVGVYIFPLFNPLNHIGLCTQIFHLTGVQICENASLPSNICKPCYSQIENFEKFKHQVQRTDCILRQQIESCGKIVSDLNVDTELDTNTVDHTFESELHINKDGLNIEPQVDSINLHNYRVENVLTLLSVQKKSPNSNTDGNRMHMTNVNSQKDLSNLVDEKEKEVSDDEEVNLCDLEEKKSNNKKNNLKDNQEQSNYSSLQINLIDGSDGSNVYTGDTDMHTNIENKLIYKPLQCEICHKIFKTKTTLRRHHVVHTEHEYHKCVECHKIFAHKHNLVKHIRIHSGVTLTCTVCQKIFTQPEYLKYHMMYTHSEGDPLSCDVCGRLYKNSVTLMMHKKNVHSNINGTNKVVCTVCGKLLGSNALSKHMKTHSVNERIKCDLCDRSYKNHYIMLEHRKSHLKLPASCCDVCGKTFKTNGVLKNHKLTHSPEKQFSCSMCGAKFTQSAALRTHHRVHSGLEPYTCSCGEKFRWKQTYDKHIFKCTQRIISAY